MDYYSRTDTLSILVVDDEPEVRELVSRVLRYLGAYQVLEAADGCEAQALIRHARPSIDLLLCDIQMPGGGADALFRQLAGQSRQPAVILMSGAGQAVLNATASLGLSLGFNVLARLAKPVTTGALTNALRSMPRDQLKASQATPGSSTHRGSTSTAAHVSRFAHEAAGPLMTVTLLTELLLDGGGLTDGQAGDLRQIQGAATQLSRMLKEFKSSYE